MPITVNDAPGYADLVIKAYKQGLVKMPNGNETTWTDCGKGSLFFDTNRQVKKLKSTAPSA